MYATTLDKNDDDPPLLLMARWRAAVSKSNAGTEPIKDKGK